MAEEDVCRRRRRVSAHAPTSGPSLVDVLIVGAGPTGLTLACDLARRGVTCRIIDQGATYHVGTRARALTPRSQEVFDDLGVIEPLLAQAEPGLPMRFLTPGGQLVREVPRDTGAPSPDAPYRSNLIISQQRTEAVLREGLAAVDRFVELGSRLVGFTQGPEYVVASVDRAGKSETIHARYLVGCDGGASTVRKGAALSFLGETAEDAQLFLGSVAVDGLTPDAGYIWLDPGRGPLMTLYPMTRDGNWWFAAGLTPDEYRALPPEVETLQRLFNERVGLAGVRFSDLTWYSIWRANIRMVDRYRVGRIFLAGDAAHVHSPAGGQGMQTGIQDAYNLGWKLAAVLRGAPAALLDTYEAERLPVARHLLESTSARAQGFARAGGAERTITNVITNRDPYSDTTQLSLHYRDSVLARDLAGTTTVRAGDRAPDAPNLRTRDGATLRLFDLFRGPHFTLLAFDRPPAPQLVERYNGTLRAYTIARPGAPPVIPNDVLIDTAGHAHRAYGVAEAALVLVRPDGYIGLTGGGGDADSIARYLRDSIGR